MPIYPKALIKLCLGTKAKGQKRQIHLICKTCKMMILRTDVRSKINGSLQNPTKLKVCKIV